MGSGHSQGGRTNIIDYITISTQGNSADFGDATGHGKGGFGCSNAVRGVFGGGSNPADCNVIDFLTIATLGDTKDFGDLSTLTSPNGGGCASSTRGLVLGRHVSNSYKNTIEFVQIMTTGNAIDFGDLTGNRQRIAASSNGHGGLG